MSGDGRHFAHASHSRKPSVQEPEPMKNPVPHSALLAFLGLILSPLGAVFASSAPADSANFCVPLEFEAREPGKPYAARKHAFSLNVGETQTVRVIYFKPNDRATHPDIDTKLDALMRDIQQFFADEMERSGFGKKPFRLETDASGRTLVHHFDGQFTAEYYNVESCFAERILPEISEQFDTSQNIYVVAADVVYPGSYWRGGGQAYIGGSSILYIPLDDPFIDRYHAGHEIGHSFGLQHDFRYRNTFGAEIMSYDVGIDFNDRRLSNCAVEWLDVHPYFNSSETSPALNEPATIRQLPPLAYPPDAISLRFEVTDPDGLHQAQLMVPREYGFSLHGCKSLNSQKNSTIEFITTELTPAANHEVKLGIIDVHGNFSWNSYSIRVDDEIERVDGVIDAGGFAPDTIQKFRWEPSGDNQVGFLNRRLTNPFVVTVRDAHDEPVAGIQVTYEVVAGGGKLSVTNPWTDSDGRAQTFLTLGSEEGEYRVAASVAGVSDEVTFSATAKNTTIIPDTPIKTLTGHTDYVSSVKYSPDGKALVTGSFDRTVRLWDAVTGQPRVTITGFTHSVYSVAYSPDGRTLAANGNWGEIRLFDAITGQHKQTLEGITTRTRETLFGHTVGVSRVAYSPDGGTLATGDLKGEIRLWDGVTGEHKATLTGHTGGVFTNNISGLAFSTDSRTFASGGTDRIIHLWDVVTGQPLKTLTGHYDYDPEAGDGIEVAFSRDGRTLASTGAWDLMILLWDAFTGQPLKTLTGHNTGVYAVAFSPDGGTLATGSFDSEIRLWDVGTGDLLNILIGHTAHIRSVAFSPDGKTLASASDDHTVRLWDVSPYVTARAVTPTLRIPTGLTSAAISSSRIDLVWQDNSADEAGFRVQRRQAGSADWVLIGATPADVTTFSDVGFVPGVLYHYRVQAFSTTAVSEFSNEAMATTRPDSLTDGGISSRLFVPVVLRSRGLAGSFFTSELTLTNRGGTTAEIQYTYTASGGTVSDTAVDSLGVREQRIIPDAIAYLTSLGVPIGSGSAAGTLAVDFSNLSSPSDAAVTVRVSTPVEEGRGRAGLAYFGLNPDGLLTSPNLITGLRQNSQDRSNLAVQNAGDTDERDITLRVTVFSGDSADPGKSFVLPDLTLAPGGFHQYNGILDRAGLDNGYVKVERLEGTAPFYAYGVINDNSNSDGSFVFPVRESSLVGKRGQTLPVLIETGAFNSELTVTNVSPVAKTVDFRFVAEAVETDDDTATVSLDLKAGEQRILPHVIDWLRQQEVTGIGPAHGAFVGALFATVAEGDMSGIVIGARTGAPDQRGGQYGLFYNGVPYGSASTESAWIYGLQQNAENRSNLALVNTGEIDDSSSTFEITIYDGSGETQPRTKTVTVGPRRWTQENGILGNFRQGYVQIRKTSGNNPFITYGVINDGGRPGERSGDGAFLLSQE